jgi:glycerol dehydrogenase
MVDPQVIADAPARFLIAGMGDALGTYFEGPRLHPHRVPEP